MAEYTTTANQGWTIPDDNDSKLNSVPDYIKALAEDIELQVVMRFANMSEFTTKVPSPADGMVMWITADNALYVYADGGPQRVWPTDPLITGGSEAPTGPGEAGQYYFQHGE